MKRSGSDFGQQSEGPGAGERQICPELLDQLPATDPRARRSRRDLRRVNWWMGNARILASTLEALRFEPFPPKLVELGGGDGTLMLAVARRLPAHWAGTALEIVDQQELLTAETAAQFKVLGWEARAVRADVFTWLGKATAVDGVLCNLFLHHFDNARLGELFGQVALRASWFIATEPRRYSFPGLAGRLVWLLGCNAVTRHDAVASVRAGFAGAELSSLWPKEGRWKLEEGAAGLFSHRFVASPV